ISLWDTNTLERRAVLRGLNDRPESMVITPDDRSLISGCYQGVIKSWDLATGRERQTLGRIGNPVCRMTVTSDGRSLATTGGDKVTGGDPVKLWHLPTGQELFSMPPNGLHFMCVAFSPDGRTLLAGTKPSTEGEACPVLMFRGAPPER